MDRREYNRNLLQAKLNEFSFQENEALWNRIETGLSIAIPVQPAKTAIKIKALGSKALTLKFLIAAASLSILVTTLLLRSKLDHSTPATEPIPLKTVPAKVPDYIPKINHTTIRNKAARIEPIAKKKVSMEQPSDSFSRVNEPIMIKNLSSTDAEPNSLIDSIKLSNKNILSLPDTIKASKNTSPIKEDGYYFDFQKKKGKRSNG